MSTTDLRRPRPVYDRNFALDKSGCHSDNSVAQPGETPIVKVHDMADENPIKPTTPEEDAEAAAALGSGPGPSLPPPSPPPPPKK